jgi:Xaa-Pro aminopeptidase
MPAILICGDTLRSPELRHEVPLGIGDPFLYLETGGRRVVLTNVLEVDRIAAQAPELERLLGEQLGRDELIDQGLSFEQVDRELYLRAVREVGITAAVVPAAFPLAVADRLRAEGIALTVDNELFVDRRREKTDAELAGIRRAADAALAGMEECARVLRESEIDGDGLRFEGEVLTSELLRARIREVCSRLGAPAPDDIIVAPMRPGDAVGHESGSGPLPAHAPICVDLWPQDEASSCWADMTRTWVRGDISDAVADLHRLVLEAHERSLAATKPGVLGVEVYGAACDVFEAAGHPTGRTKKPGESLQHGFFFGLGHGVGLEVHEEPALGRTGRAPLVAGDVVAIEPGIVDPEHGGMRVEDLVLVTDDGYELLTERSYDLTP